MTAPAIARNAAGVPLILLGTASGNSITIDQSQVPAGINGKTYSKADIDADSSTDQQTLMNDLAEKYRGVDVEIGAQNDYDEEFAMTVEDLATYHELIAVGATWPNAAANATKPDTEAPAPITQNTPVVVPRQVAEQLPIGTIVTKTAAGVHVASVPVNGTTHHIFASVGEQLLYLVSAVSAYFTAKNAGASSVDSALAGVGTLAAGETAPHA